MRHLPVQVYQERDGIVAKQRCLSEKPTAQRGETRIGDDLVHQLLIWSETGKPLEMDETEETAEYIDTSEIEYEVSGFKVTKLDQVGSVKWFEKTVKVSRLYRVAASESMVEPQTVERVKTALMTYSKCDAMVRELVTIGVWRENVLKRMLKIKPPPTTVFPSYMALYYEVMVHGIVQAMVFHGDTFNYLLESCDDLVEYCVSKIRQLIRPPKFVTPKEMRKLEQEPLDEIKTQHRYIDFNVGSQCIATLRYVCENLEYLPLSVSTRIYSTHDLPVLVSQLLDQNVWTKREGDKTYKFNETDWQEVRNDDPPLSKMECQVWLLLRQMLLNTNSSTAYHYSDYRREQLAKLLKHLNDRVLDQLSVLVDLQRMLHFLVMRAPTEGDKPVHNPLIVEITPLFVDQLVQKYSNQWDDLAQAAATLLFYPNNDQTKNLTKIFSQSIQPMMTITKDLHCCQYCMKRAANRCSQCKRTWYCSRSCQVQHWQVHKNSCSST